jgi:hypothetical protein
MDDLVKWARGAQVFCPADWADRIEALEREDRKDMLLRHGTWLAEQISIARNEALEEAAREIACHCPDAEKVALLPPNGGERWRLCGEANCMAIKAADIRALKDTARD